MSLSDVPGFSLSDVPGFCWKNKNVDIKVASRHTESPRPSMFVTYLVYLLSLALMASAPSSVVVCSVSGCMSAADNFSDFIKVRL